VRQSELGDVQTDGNKELDSKDHNKQAHNKPVHTGPLRVRMVCSKPVHNTVCSRQDEHGTLQKRTDGISGHRPVHKDCKQARKGRKPVHKVYNRLGHKDCISEQYGQKDQLGQRLLKPQE